MTDLIATYKENQRLAILQAAATLMAGHLAHGQRTLEIGVYVAQAREILDVVEMIEVNHEV